MAHKFDSKNKDELDTERRRKMLSPEKTLTSLGLHEGDIMADIGCGIGYFSIPASKIVGNNGKIFALDILPEMLCQVEIKAKENNCSNIKTVLTEENDLKLEEETITYAFLSVILHETEQLDKFLENVKKIISPKGKIAIIEWKKINSKDGPPIEHRLDKLEIIKLLDILGFSDISILDISENLYGITAQKTKD
ncbi:class I SAM-dependent methyltransferase [Clostridium sp. JN-9]|uniref:class I SAM-dependent methyltransferase n=1 Tax=Clostridium sp. JN-9 TaxID=2507159 RepID=UPI000FFE016A|nr:class I SAM-dependent methyltransferase [Clostridium sp. JN-9]QAT39774.1 methyltransferase domain-containing protein [Clostridium sp. JN-9]